MVKNCSLVDNCFEYGIPITILILNNFSECTVRVTVTGGSGKIRIDTLERYMKKNGGDIARRKQIKSNTFEFQFKYQKGNSLNLNRDTVMGRVVTI